MHFTHHIQRRNRNQLQCRYGYRQQPWSQRYEPPVWLIIGLMIVLIFMGGV